jgi:hypothetical protein
MLSKCPSCNSGFFENQEKTVSGYQFKLNFIQCAGCGSVVGVMPYYDPGITGHANEKALKELNAKSI